MSFQGFRLGLLSGQSVLSAGAEVDWEEVAFDSTGQFSASPVVDRFEVPSALNGAVMCFTFGTDTNGGAGLMVAIERSTDAGSTWETVAGREDNTAVSAAAAAVVSTGPITVATGHLFRAWVRPSTTRTLQVDGTFFSGFVIPTAQWFRAHQGVAQVIAQTTTATMTFDVEDADTEAAFASDVFTVPAGLDGSYMAFYAGALFNSRLAWLNIERSTDNGLSWHAIGGQTTFVRSGVNTYSGPVQVSTGHQFRALLRNNSGSGGDLTTVVTGPSNFFSGMVVGS